ncbi:TraY domain-containing protein (plasmid) [Escherichia coli]
MESLLIEASNRSGRSRSFEAVIRLKIIFTYQV